MIDFSKDVSGVVVVDFGGEKQYLSKLDNVIVSGKPDAYFSNNPIVTKPQVRINWRGGSLVYFLDEITINSVEQDDLDAAVLELATTIFNPDLPA